jgi:hypothetical protein
MFEKTHFWQDAGQIGAPTAHQNEEPHRMIVINFIDYH